MCHSSEDEAHRSTSSSALPDPGAELVSVWGGKRGHGVNPPLVGPH
jgi:hypothetical protein